MLDQVLLECNRAVMNVFTKVIAKLVGSVRWLWSGFRLLFRDLSTSSWFAHLQHLVISARPRQWLKNLALLAPAYFWGDLFNWSVARQVVSGVILFSILSSAMYLFNDVLDREKDQAHPLKKNRPVARGDLSPGLALGASATLLAITLFLSFQLSPYFFLLAFAYATLQVIYSLLLRDVIIMDALAIALGFIFRVFAGALIVPVPISSWLILATIGLSLLMAFGKRRSERTLLASLGGNFLTRESLGGYPDTLLDSVISTFASFTILSYSIFAFQTSPKTTVLPGILPSTLAQPKWMMLTVPLVIYGVARYLYVIYEKKEGESPDKVIISDRPLLISVLLWVAAVGLIVYRLGV